VVKGTNINMIKERLLQLKNFILGNRLDYLLIFSLVFIFFLLTTAPPTLICPDSFYHTKMALLIKERGVIQNFPWTQFVSFGNEKFVDQHFGFHLLLIPFLSIPSPKNLDNFSQEIEPLLKAKLAVLFFASLIFVLIYWFLKSFRIKGAIFYTFLPLFISPFLIRITFTRAPVVSIIFLLLGIYLILKEKYFWLFILSFLYVWLYGAWPLILLVVIIHCFARAIKNIFDFGSKNWIATIRNLIRYFFSKNNLKLIVACIFGLTLGLVINPYFPKDIYFHFNEVLKIAIINYHHKIGVGAEWYPFNPFDFFVYLYPILIFWLIASAWFIANFRKQNLANWTLFFLSTFFLVYSWKARRNVEYFVPLALLFIGFSFQSLWSIINWSIYWQKIKEFFQPEYQLLSYILMLFKIFILIFFFGTILFLGPVCFYYNYENGFPFFKFQAVSHWLKDNTPAGSIVYNVSWDIFPPLFYFNTQNYYINGLDQTFMYEYSPELYEKWEKIFKGSISPTELSSIIKNDFKSSYVLIEKNEKKTQAVDNLFKRSVDFRKVYEDIDATVFQLVK
jgi:hypothetical protein